ncbi:AraC family transcriptional regulator [Allokutzneria multivorans]|uniref:AraC family transcriptional regulator n=1 Tax=Allokutzneria multivorans TaxID=1142134 RepID=UPI0031E56A60
MDDATTSEHGVLDTGDPSFRLERMPSSLPLVERYWTTSWDVPAGRTASVTLLPHPCVNLVYDRGQVLISGVGRERFTYSYQGTGRVFGIKFRPGGFQPFYGSSVAELTDQVRPLSTLWGSSADDFAASLSVASDPVAVAERFLLERWPARVDPEVFLVERIVHALLRDREVARVGDVTERFGISVRTLQRLFRRYVGVGPKWVLKRYRLHEAAGRLAAGESVGWAELGYCDQSHFIRDFVRVVGVSPSVWCAGAGVVA